MKNFQIGQSKKKKSYKIFYQNAEKVRKRERRREEKGKRGDWNNTKKFNNMQNEEK